MTRLRLQARKSPLRASAKIIGRKGWGKFTPTYCTSRAGAWDGLEKRTFVKWFNKGSPRGRAWDGTCPTVGQTLFDPEALAMFREAMKEHAGRSTKESTNNVSTIQGEGRNTAHGNSRAYSIDRVKRSCEPEVVAKVMASIVAATQAAWRAAHARVDDRTGDSIEGVLRALWGTWRVYRRLHFSKAKTVFTVLRF